MPATRQTDTIKLSHMNEPTEKNQPFLSSSADSILFLFHKMALYLLMFDHLDNLQCSHCSNPYKSPCSRFSAPWPPFWFWLCARGERPLPFPISGYVHLKLHVLYYLLHTKAYFTMSYCPFLIFIRQRAELFVTLIAVTLYWRYSKSALFTVESNMNFSNQNIMQYVTRLVKYYSVPSANKKNLA